MCIDDDYIYVPIPSSALLGPGLRKALFRYGSMKEVSVSNDAWTHDLLVKYTLITGESKTVHVPARLWVEDRYDEIIRLVTKDLG